MAILKHNNNSISNVTSFPQVPSESPVLLSTATASASSSISFTSGIDSTYDVYYFEFVNMHPANQTEFTFQVSTNGGSTYATTVTSSFFRAYHDEADTASDLQYNASQDLAQSTSFQILSESGNNSDNNTSGYLHLFNPSSNTYVKHFMSNFNFLNNSNFNINTYCAGYFNTTSAINAVQFKMSSGNIDAGTIKMYGIKGN